MTYVLKGDNGLHIIYDAVADQDTVFNLTNHSYFNLAGHQNTDKALSQELIMPARFFNPDDVDNIPTGELRDVSGLPKPLAGISSRPMSPSISRAAMTTISRSSAIPVPF